jgi:hypothetical protein
MHSVGGNLKEVLLEYDGKPYREFLILLVDRRKTSLPPPKKKSRYLCMGMGGKYL